MNTHAVMDHKAAFARLDEGQQGYLDAGTTATIAGMLGQSVPQKGTE